jgi:prepilin-type N-terminal cleavage/methylation domain
MKYRQRGFTLIELLITLLLSSVVIAGVSQAFLQSRKSFIQQQALSFISEDGRYAIEVLTQELRRAGFFGEFPAQ